MDGALLAQELPESRWRFSADNPRSDWAVAKYNGGDHDKATEKSSRVRARAADNGFYRVIENIAVQGPPSPNCQSRLENLAFFNLS